MGDPHTTYPSPGGMDLGFDLYLPADLQSPTPLVVMLHGGGWISGDRSMYAPEAEELVPHGYACACIDYRLAPLYTFPAAVADCQAFVRHARSMADEWNVDPNRIAALGNSAGGHLALMMALAPPVEGQDEPSSVNAAAAICPITDIRKAHTAHLPISYDFLEQFIGERVGSGGEKWAQASPLAHLGDDPPPIWLAHGAEDDIVPVAQSREMHAALKEKGATTDFLELPGEGHSFTFSGWSRLQEGYRAFLGEHL